jgi:hypothetical protein
MIKTSYYLDTRRARKDGTYPVKILVSANGTNFLLSVGMTSGQSEWTGDGFSKRDPNAKVKNIYLRDMMNKVEKHILLVDNQNLDMKKLKKDLECILNGNEPNDRKRLADAMAEYEKTIGKQGTMGYFIATRTLVEEYDSSVYMDEVNVQWLEKFCAFLKSKRLRTNTISLYMTSIRRIFNYEIDNGANLQYPFRKFHMGRENTRKRNLSVERLRALRDAKIVGRSSDYRDFFMLSFYLIGINIADLFGDCVIENGRLEYRRAKTGRLYSIKLEPEAIAIIEKHGGSLSGFNFQKISGVKNVPSFSAGLHPVLRKIKDNGGHVIEPDLTWYWARHTWATIAASLDIPKETISAALGHEIGSPITSIYIDFNQKKVDEANRKVIDYVNGTDVMD